MVSEFLQNSQLIFHPGLLDLIFIGSVTFISTLSSQNMLYKSNGKEKKKRLLLFFLVITVLHKEIK